MMTVFVVIFLVCGGSPSSGLSTQFKPHLLHMCGTKFSWMYFLENHDLMMFNCVNISVVSCLPAQVQSLLLFAGSVEVDGFLRGFPIAVVTNFLFVVVIAVFHDALI